MSKNNTYTLSVCCLSYFIAECCKLKPDIDPTLTPDQKIQDVCNGDIKYGNYSHSKPWKTIVICRSRKISKDLSVRHFLVTSSGNYFLSSSFKSENYLGWRRGGFCYVQSKCGIRHWKRWRHTFLTSLSIKCTLLTYCILTHLLHHRVIRHYKGRYLWRQLCKEGNLQH